MTPSNHDLYTAFFTKIKNRIDSAKIRAARTINHELIRLYWDMGQIIFEKQKQNSWGQKIVEKLSTDLGQYFHGAEGFSANNLWRMRNFYLAYKNTPKLAQLVQEIPWGQNIVILQTVKNPKEREYYVRSTIALGWSRNVLLNQIKEENPSIGIILCVQKDDITVEYALRRTMNPLGVSEYRLTTKPTKELSAILPKTKDMKKNLLSAENFNDDRGIQ